MDDVPRLSDFELGYLLALLSGEGHFGGDGRQPQITLRMHTRHEGIFRWLEARLPGAKLYGPYSHGGRNYFQWMARGPYLRAMVVPLIAGRVDWLDDHVRARFNAMCRRYSIPLVELPPVPGSIASGHFSD